MYVCVYVCMYVSMCPVESIYYSSYVFGANFFDWITYQEACLWRRGFLPLSAAINCHLGVELWESPESMLAMSANAVITKVSLK